MNQALLYQLTKKEKMKKIISKKIILLKYGLILYMVYNLLGAFEFLVGYHYSNENADYHLPYASWLSQIIFYFFTFLFGCMYTFAIILTFYLKNVFYVLIKKDFLSLFLAYTILSFICFILINWFTGYDKIKFLFFNYLPSFGFVLYLQTRVEIKLSQLKNESTNKHDTF